MPDAEGLRSAMVRFLDGDNESRIARKRHRSRIIILLGIVLTVVMGMISLCVGQDNVIGPIEALSSLFSAIGKDTADLTKLETLVYYDRLPRLIMTLSAGIGLSIAGATYQAMIRNPLVDPYIMGVSSGAGTFAIATIALDFTFFGLISATSPYLTAVSALAGGILAFSVTMIIANRAGSTTNSFVLAGVVVGLLFSAAQTVMIKFADDKVVNAMTWLFGSFANTTLTEAGIVAISVAVTTILVMTRAKELNLILLGQDQASQMGLNVKRFNIAMLIVASIMASVCVAFVGIIGFVGLVIPHLCRMIFGGDHRLVLPASIALGAPLMIAADLLARMVIHAQELPVGTITTIIGVPVFAYLLMKRGKMYNG